MKRESEKVYRDGECREDLGFQCPIIKPFTVRQIYFLSMVTWTKHQHVSNTYLDIRYERTIVQYLQSCVHKAVYRSWTDYITLQMY